MTGKEIMHHRLSLESWYQTPLGQYLLEQLKTSMDSVLTTCFGYYALHIGCESLSPMLMENTRINHVFRLGSHPQYIDVLADSHTLPIANDSTDLVVLMHALSQAKDPHGILRESQYAGFQQKICYLL